MDTNHYLSNAASYLSKAATTVALGVSLVAGSYGAAPKAPKPGQTQTSARRSAPSKPRTTGPARGSVPLRGVPSNAPSKSGSAKPSAPSPAAGSVTAGASALDAIVRSSGLLGTCTFRTPNDVERSVYGTDNAHVGMRLSRIDQVGICRSGNAVTGAITAFNGYQSTITKDSNGIYHQFTLDKRGRIEGSEDAFRITNNTRDPVYVHRFTAEGDETLYHAPQRFKLVAGTKDVKSKDGKKVRKETAWALQPGTNAERPKKGEIYEFDMLSEARDNAGHRQGGMFCILEKKDVRCAPVTRDFMSGKFSKGYDPKAKGHGAYDHVFDRIPKALRADYRR